MEKLTVLNDIDIRLYTPTLKSEIKAPVRPIAVLNALHVWRDGEKFIVRFESDCKNFYNRIDLLPLILLVAILAKCNPCLAERTIQKFDMPEFNLND